jgi:hypothetical protein
MADQSDDREIALAPGVRVQICNDTLQAFYGRYGTVLHIRTCPRSGHITRVDVHMDDLPAGEEPASFYPTQLSVLV